MVSSWAFMAFSTPEGVRQADGEEAGHKRARVPWSLYLVSDVAPAAEGPTYRPRSPPLLQAGFSGWAESPGSGFFSSGASLLSCFPSPNPTQEEGPWPGRPHTCCHLSCWCSWPQMRGRQGGHRDQGKRRGRWLSEIGMKGALGRRGQGQGGIVARGRLWGSF